MLAGPDHRTPGLWGRLLEPVRSLLDIVRGHKFPVHDVPVASFTAVARAYVNAEPRIDLDHVGEFAASTSYLMLVKSRGLLTEEEPDEEIEPAEMAVRAAYGSGPYHMTVEALQSRWAAGLETIPRGEHVAPANNILPLLPADLLRRTFERQVRDMRERGARRLPPPVFIRLEMATRSLQKSLGRVRQLSFFSLIREARLDRQAAVVYFLALLDLMRNRSVRLAQQRPFGDIVIETAAANDAADERAEAV